MQLYTGIQVTISRFRSTGTNTADIQDNTVKLLREESAGDSERLQLLIIGLQPKELLLITAPQMILGD